MFRRTTDCLGIPSSEMYLLDVFSVFAFEESLEDRFLHLGTENVRQA